MREKMGIKGGGALETRTFSTPARILLKDEGRRVGGLVWDNSGSKGRGETLGSQKA